MFIPSANPPWRHPLLCELLFWSLKFSFWPATRTVVGLTERSTTGAHLHFPPCTNWKKPAVNHTVATLQCIPYKQHRNAKIYIFKVNLLKPCSLRFDFHLIFISFAKQKFHPFRIHTEWMQVFFWFLILKPEPIKKNKKHIHNSNTSEECEEGVENTDVSVNDREWDPGVRDHERINWATHAGTPS